MGLSPLTWGGWNPNRVGGGLGHAVKFHAVWDLNVLPDTTHRIETLWVKIAACGAAR